MGKLWEAENQGRKLNNMTISINFFANTLEGTVSVDNVQWLKVIENTIMEVSITNVLTQWIICKAFCLNNHYRWKNETALMYMQKGNS